jgi:hypothetical protein
MNVRLGAFFVGFLVACTPLRDLDEAARGEDGASGEATGGAAGSLDGSSGSMVVASAGGALVGTGGESVNGGSGGETGITLSGAPSSGGHNPVVDRPDASPPVVNEAGAAPGGAAAEQGGASGLGEASGSGGAPAAGAGARGTSMTGGASGAGQAGSFSASNGGRRELTDLPIDLPNSPVTGTFTVSSEAVWEVNGKYVPTYEIHTPTASYWVVKSLGMLVSLSDKHPNDPHQWIDYSTGFRPLRGLPSYGTFGATETMSTSIDTESQTPTHLRLLSTSKSWRLVWDFYPTHVTITVTAAPVPYGFAYRGVPAGAFDSMDRFTLGTGESQSGQISSTADLQGPAEWAYVSDSARKCSLFMIQHGDDALPDRYQVKDNDSAMLSFGDGMLTALPMRFSFGIIQSADHETVKTRASFVIDAIR